jgi:hypothetical protein
VLRLSEQLRQDGIETILDRYVEHGSPPEGWPRWMLNSLDSASHILCVCTQRYYLRFRGHEVPDLGKGVDWEGAHITQSLYDARSVSSKFIPVLFTQADEAFIPEPLRAQNCYLVDSEAGYKSLYDVLLNQSGVNPGPIGSLKREQRPDASQIIKSIGGTPAEETAAHGFSKNAVSSTTRQEDSNGSPLRIPTAWDRKRILSLSRIGFAVLAGLAVGWKALTPDSRESLVSPKGRQETSSDPGWERILVMQGKERDLLTIWEKSFPEPLGEAVPPEQIHKQSKNWTGLYNEVKDHPWFENNQKSNKALTLLAESCEWHIGYLDIIQFHSEALELDEKWEKLFTLRPTLADLLKTEKLWKSFNGIGEPPAEVVQSKENWTMLEEQIEKHPLYKNSDDMQLLKTYCQDHREFLDNFLKGSTKIGYDDLYAKYKTITAEKPALRPITGWSP